MPATEPFSLNDCLGKRGFLTIAKELLFAQDSIKSFNDRKFT